MLLHFTASEVICASVSSDNSSSSPKVVVHIKQGICKAQRTEFGLVCVLAIIINP